MRKSWIGYAFISPWLLGFLIFALIPFMTSIYLSFTRYNIITPPHWVGLANYRMLLTGDPQFWKSLGVTFRYAGAAVPLGIVAGVTLALLLNLNIKGMAVYRTIFFLPSIVPTVATSVVFMRILNPEIGLVKVLLPYGSSTKAKCWFV